ncbi:MAG: Asd/ArgC dimerization domain-containing protein [Terriglobales bacterium]
MPPYRIAVQGATTLLGKELHAALGARHFPALPAVLVAAPAASAAEERTLAEVGEEAAVLEPCTRETLAGCQAVFLAGTAAEAQAVAALAPESAALVDLSGGLGEPAREAGGTLLTGLEAKGAAADATTSARVLLPAHPAAQVLAHLLERLQLAGRLQTAVATVFEPVSQRGWAGVQELQQQSLRLLSMQSLPQETFDAQVAFNLRARLGEKAQPSLGSVRRRIAAEVAALGAPVAPALSVFQAPVFHASMVSLYVRFAGAVALEAVLGVLTSPWLTPSAEYPDMVTTAGTDTIPLGPVRRDETGGYWLLAGVDNLRRTAFSAADAALAWLGARNL